MMVAIRKYRRDAIAIVVLFVVALGVGGYILSQQRFYLPGWVPFVGQSFFTLKAEFSTAQSVTPGQGQSVDIAGVKVGDITDVQLRNGRAVVTMKMKKKYAGVHRDATLLLRPKTGLNDIIAQLSPGSKDQPLLKDGATIPVAQTLPNVNTDEILASLDADTRDYLKLLLGGLGGGLKGEGRPLSATFRRFEPTGRDLLRITRALAGRRQNLRRVIHNFQLISTEVGSRDTELARLVDSSNAVFAAFAHQEGNLRQTIRELPGALGATRSALHSTDVLARQLGPALQRLRPGARALAPSLRATRPFLAKTAPVIQNRLRPFTRAARPTVQALRPAAADLAKLTPDLVTSFKVINALLNTLAYNPPGPADEGFLFWASWANHDGGSVFATQDAHGSIRRGLFVTSCSSLGVLNQIAQVNPALSVLTQLLNAPTQSQACPSSTGAQGGAQP
jgi:phospholipid/cholesterol/gamma-HCH transport system substrate-binding protein